MKKPKKRQDRTNAVIYCRVSTEEQVANLSLSTQQQRAISHCALMGWPVIRVFRDEGKSAKTLQRDEFQNMLKFCDDPANAVGYVVVHDLSRFSRNAHDLMTARTVLYAAGVSLRSVSESIDETSMGNFVTTVLGAVHQFDNDRKAERTKTGMQAAAALGRWPHKAPIGYKNVTPEGDGPNIVPDEQRAGLVRMAFELVATGLHSKADVLRVVTARGLDTAKASPLSPQTFQKVLENPIYAGWMRFSNRDDRIQGSFQPLITLELFDKVQDVLTDKRPALTAYERNRAEFPLRRFVRCASCGMPLTASWSKGRKKKYAYYRCREKGCYAVSIKPDELHREFLLWLVALAPQPSCMDAIKVAIRDVWNQRQGDAEELRLVLNQKLQQAEKRKTTLVTRWLDGLADNETYRDHKSRLSDEIDGIRAALRNTEMENIELERVLDFADRIILRPERLWVESSVEQRQRLQRTLFPNGIAFDGEKFGTDSTPLFFNLIPDDPDDQWGLASPTGFEPVLSP